MHVTSEKELESHIRTMTEMGVPEEDARNALLMCEDHSIEGALDWLDSLDQQSEEVNTQKEDVTGADVGLQYEMDLDAPILRNLGPTAFFHLFEMVKHANKHAVSRRGVLVEENAWDFMKRHLWDIEPEDLDSVRLCVARRQRRYVHNIPFSGRPIQIPQPAPLTIAEMWADSVKYFPSWDRRLINGKLNMINTKALHQRALTVLNNKLRTGMDLDDEDKARIRSWNLIFRAPQTVVNLTEEEVEKIMGYPKDHTRHGAGKDEVLRMLGNAFQVDTIAYILSPIVDRLKQIPGGITLISLFDGIGGLAVALRRWDVRIKRYISVESCPHCRTVVQNWWKKNNFQETGTLEFVNDIRDLDTAALARIVNEGPVDLVGGGSPCNQLTRNNRQSTENPRGRSGVLGVDSRLFLEYPRVLNQLEMLQLRAGKRPVVPV